MMDFLTAIFEFVTDFLAALSTFLNDKSTFDEMADIIGSLIDPTKAAE